ncbi:ribonuclease H-like domain-containing protein [Tanacetum coccineum]
MNFMTSPPWPLYSKGPIWGVDRLFSEPRFFRALHPKWRAKVTAIEESKDLSSLALDELISNLKVHEVVMEKDSEIYKGKKKRVKSIALKAKKEFSDDETSTSGSDDEEYAMAVRNFKKFFRRKGKFVRQPREEKKSFRQRDNKKGKSDRKCFRCGDPNHLIGECPKPPRNKDQKAFVGGCWSDNENEVEDKTNDETCLMDQSSNEVCLRTCLEPDECIKDSSCSKHMTGNKSLFSTYKAYDGGKQAHASHKAKNMVSTNRCLELLHMDLFGPSPVKSYGEELFTHKEEMDLETAQTNTTAKLPLLKQGEYEMWKLRIEQYFQVQDYALWDVIENGNSFKPVARTTTNADGTSTSLIPGPVTADEKTQKKNDVKARSMLLMALPNEHLLTFNQYKDAKTLFAAIQIRFGGNDAKKKTQKTLLKQMYENFNDPSIESLDSIFNRLQKIVSQLAILGEIISQEDLNLNFLRSLPSEWNTHVVVWRNKPDLDTMSFDDLYNNFKIVEQEVKGTANSSSSSSSQNMAFMSSPSSTNEVNTANIQVSPASTQVSTASTQVSTANLSDATVYAFLANQPNGSQLVHEDLEQIHEDDLEEMDLKWQLALLSMRTRRFFQKTGRKITINGSDTAGYDKSKVECFNCHKLGHFARECRGSRKQDSRNWNQDSSKRTINVEDTSSKAMLAIDGAGFDWSYMADDEVPTNMALMAFSDSEVHNDKTCSKTCLKSFETLKTQLDDLRIEFNKSEFNLATYKKGLAYVEEKLIFYKKNEVLFCEQIAVLKRDISYKDSKISELKSELEKHKQEKENNQVKIENFDNASKRLFAPPTLDLSNSGLEEFQQPEFEGYGPKISKSVSENVSNEIEFVKQQEKPDKKPVKYAEMYRSQDQTAISIIWEMVGHPQKEDQGYVDSGCSRHMTGNMSYLSDFKEFDGGYVTFRGGAKGGRITGKGTLKTDKLDFEDVYFVEELQFNLFSISQMCDKKNSVLFTDTGCFFLSPDFKLADESQVLLKVPRKNNMYSVDMKNIVPK